MLFCGVQKFLNGTESLVTHPESLSQVFIHMYTGGGTGGTLCTFINMESIYPWALVQCDPFRVSQVRP